MSAFRLLIGVIVCFICGLSATPEGSQLKTPFTMFPGHSLLSKMPSHSSSYYKVVIPANTQQRYLLITATTSTTAPITIFISLEAKNTNPNEQNYTIICTFTSLDTCIIDLKQEQSPQIQHSVYYSVFVETACSIKVSVSIQNPLQIQHGKYYNVTFDDRQSIIAVLSGTQFKDNSTGIGILAQYQMSSIANAGKFNILAALNQLPNSGKDNSTLDLKRSINMGLYRQYIKLPVPTNLTAENEYFIVIQGQKGSNLNIIVNDSDLNPILNTPFYGLVQSDSTYVLPIQIGSAPPMDELIISLYSYSKFGFFEIQYCGDLSSYQSQNIDGFNGQILISKQQRAQCYKAVQTAGQSVQQVLIRVTNITSKFAFMFQIEQSNSSFQIAQNREIYGQISTSMISRNYSIKHWNSSISQLYFQYQVISGTMQFSINECDAAQNCTNIPIAPEKTTNLTMAEQRSYSLTIVNKGNQTGKYLAKIGFNNQQPLILTVGSTEQGVVSMNQYKYYVINTKLLIGADSPNENTQIEIVLSTINGQALLLASLTQTQPTFDITKDQSSDVKTSFKGQISYKLNEDSQNIFVGVLGWTDVYYHLHAYIENTQQEESTKYYQKLLDNSDNELTIIGNINGTGVTRVWYASHSIPYKITFNPSPDCIRFSPSILIPDISSCMTLPTQFDEEVMYFVITQNNLTNGEEFKLTAHVDSRVYTLQANHPLFISCQKQCYQLVKVEMLNQGQLQLVHEGLGNVALQADWQNPYTSSLITINCTVPPCTYILNASLPYSGYMRLAYANGAGTEINWSPNYLTWSVDKANHLFMRISSFSLKSSFLIYAAGLTPKIYYNIYSIDNRMLNLINFEYPDSDNFMFYHSTDPINKLHLIKLNTSHLQSLRCYQQSVTCLVTVAVYVDPTIQFNLGYLQNGYGQFSSNEYSYYLPLNQVYVRMEQFNLIHFHHDIQLTENDTRISSIFRIDLQPISNCRPYILGEDSSKTYLTKIIQLPYASPTVQFDVVSLKPQCMFKTILSQYQFMGLIGNLVYTIELKTMQYTTKSPQFIGIYNHQFIRSTFQVFLQLAPSNNYTILAKKLQNETNDEILALPETSYPFSVNNNNILTINNVDQNTLWIVKIATKRQKESTQLINLMIYDQTKPITTLDNQIQQQMWLKEASKTIQYVYTTSSRFLIKYLLLQGEVRVVVKPALGPDQFILDQNISANKTSQSLLVKTNISQITTYSITFQALSSKKTFIVFKTRQEPARQEKSNISHISNFIQLYEGIAVTDGFIYFGAQNCYIYESGLLLGRKENITIDFVFVDSMKNVDSADSNLNLSIESKVIFSNGTTIYPPLISLNGIGYRISFAFQAETTYTVCFMLRDVSKVANSYYIIVNQPGIPHLPLSNPVVSTLSTLGIQMYQLLNLQTASFIPPNSNNPSNKNLSNNNQLLALVINCLGNHKELELYSSSNFLNTMTGQFQTMQHKWSEGPVYMGMNEASPNYNYLELVGQKNSTFRLQYFWVDANFKLTAEQWGLSSTIIDKVRVNHENITVELPKIINLVHNMTYNIKHTVYTLYIYNTTGLKEENETSYKPKFSLQALSKCPELFSDSAELNKIQKYSKLIVGSTQAVNFEIPSKDTPHKFDIAALAQIYLQIHGPTGTSHVVIPYYYSVQNATVEDDSGLNDVLFTILLSILIVLVLIVLCGAGCIWKYFLRIRRSRVYFQQARLVQNRQQAPPQVQLQFQNKPQVDRQFDEKPAIQSEGPANSSTPSSKKAMNENIGYGEFVDETQ